MLKKELVEALSFSKECLSKQNLTPILSHFCFTPSSILTSNGTQGIVVECETGLNCAIPGDVFYNLLNSINAEELKFVMGERSLVVKAGKSTSRFETLPTTNYAFSLPNSYTTSPSVSITEDFIKGVKKCLTTVNKNPSLTNQFGVTLTPTSLYSTDDIRISKYTLHTPLTNLPQTFKYLLPPTFCDLLSKFAGHFNYAGQLFFGSGYVVAEFGRVKLYTKVITDVDFLDYERIITMTCSQNTPMLSISGGMNEVVERCKIFLSSEIDGTVKIEAGGGEIEFEAKGKYGLHREEVQVEGIPTVGIFFVDIEYLSNLLNIVTSFTFFKAEDKVVTIGKEDAYLQLLSSMMFKGGEE